MQIKFRSVYNLTNLVGVCLLGFGFGIIKLEYGLIASGAVVLTLNVFTFIIGRR